MRADCRTGLTVHFFIDQPFSGPEYLLAHPEDVVRAAEQATRTSRAATHNSLVALAHALARQAASEHTRSTFETEG